MTDIAEEKSTIQKILSWVYQIGIFAILFYAISWWQQKDMLPANNQSTAPTMILTSVKGEVITVDAKLSKKKTLVYFFAPWCGVCHVSIDNLENIKQSSSNTDLDIYVVALDWRSIEEVKEFLAKHSLTMPILLGTNKTQQDFKIPGFPSYYLLSNSGKILSKSMGYSTELGLKMRLLLNDN